jgi:hypothetical protein
MALLTLMLLPVVASAKSPTKAAAAKPKPEAAAPSPPPQATHSQASAVPAEPESKGSREVVRRESRIEFDERLVQGQRASGAIYLFQREESDFRSMVEPPSSFIQRTIRRVFPADTTP